MIDRACLDTDACSPCIPTYLQGPLSQGLDGINWVLGRMQSSGRRSVINMSFGEYLHARFLEVRVFGDSV